MSLDPREWHDGAAHETSANRKGYADSRGRGGGPAAVLEVVGQLCTNYKVCLSQGVNHGTAHCQMHALIIFSLTLGINCLMLKKLPSPFQPPKTD